MSQSVVPPVMGVLNIAFGGFSFLAGLFNIASLLLLKKSRCCQLLVVRPN